MDTSFVYDKYVTGKHFVGHKDDCSVLGNLLCAGEHISLYSAPKQGKTSLIQQTLFNLKLKGVQFNIAEINIMNVRSIASFVTRLGDGIIRSCASTPDEYKSLVQEYLGGTHLVFDEARYSNHDEILSLSWDLDESDIAAVVRLPFALARRRETRLFIIMDEFESVMDTEDGDKLLKAMENVLKEMRQGGAGSLCSYIFCGSALNAMKHIFEQKHYFHRLVERAPLRPVEDKEIIEHVVRGFLSGGKVIDRDLVLGVCRLMRNSLWHINHFCAICDGLSKGYISEPTLNDALRTIISIHEPRYMAIMRSLTTFQVRLLDAILDGHTRFSASEVIAKYELNSSANVKRLKDALVKKEVITFNEKDEPILPDPLFEYWVRKYYFEKNV